MSRFLLFEMILKMSVFGSITFFQIWAKKVLAPNLLINPYSGLMTWAPLVDENERAKASSIFENYIRAIPMDYKDIVNASVTMARIKARAFKKRFKIFEMQITRN